MTIKIHQGNWSIESDEVETRDRGTHALPMLGLTGRRFKQTSEVIWLENELLRVIVDPSLGGRILGARNLVGQVDILSDPSQLNLTSGGPRGVALPQGIEWVVGTNPRLNSLGPVDAKLVQGDEGGPVALLVHELCTGLGLSWHGCVTLTPGRADLLLELRAFNRLLTPTACELGLRIALGGESCLLDNGAALYDASTDTGFIATWAPNELDGYSVTTDGVFLARSLGSDSILGPRQVDAWSVRWFGLHGLGRLDAASRELAAGVHPQELRLLSVIDREAKVFIQCRDGATLEAEVSLNAGEVLALPLGGSSADPTGLVVRSFSGDELVRWQKGGCIEAAPARKPSAVLQALSAKDSREVAFFSAVDKLTVEGDPSDDLRLGERIPGLASISFVGQAMAALRAGDFALARGHAESALLTNSEDHLIWWLRSVAERLDSECETPSDALPNAHFLAPLEPVLKAEAFLATTGEASSLLKSLAEDPDAASEVVCLYLECGLYDQAARLLLELLRHRENAMLRYLLAWCHMKATSLEAEVAEQVRKASESPLGPPYPWRKLELKVLRDLANEFPADERLKVERAQC